LNSLSKFHWLSSSAVHNQYIFTSFAAFSKSKIFLILEHTKSYIEKIHSVDAELAEHARKLDVKLQILCGSSFSPFAVRMLANPYHLEVNWPKHIAKSKMEYIGLPSIFNFECHNRYNKLLCNSENSDIAWWNKNNWDFSVFFEKRAESCFFLKNPGGLFFFKKNWVFSQPWLHILHLSTSLAIYISKYELMIILLLPCIVVFHIDTVVHIYGIKSWDF